MNRPEKISKLAYYLMDKEPLFYLFIINTDFILDETDFGSDYAGVTYKDGRVKFHYTQKFAELPIRKLYFVLIHEAYHIFKKHISIHLDLQKKNFLLCNIAEDSIINSEILSSTFNGISPDVEGMDPFFIPEDFIREYRHLGTDAYVTPRLFNYLLNKNKLSKKEILLKNGFCKNTKTGVYGKVLYEYEENSFYVYPYKNTDEMLENARNGRYPSGNLNVQNHIDDLIPVFINSSSEGYSQAIYEDESESFGFADSHEKTEEKIENKETEAISQQVFVEKIVRQAREITDNNPAIKKAAGKNKGTSVLDKLENLLKPEVNWKKVFKKNINLYYSNNSITKSKKKSILTYLMNAKSRYGFIFPHWIKVKDKLQKYIFIAVDTSGSCFSDTYDMERFFSEIDKISEELEFSSTGKVFVMQWDWIVTKSFVEYKKGDWKNFVLQGGGGTNPRCIFEHISNVLKPVGNSLFGYLDGDSKKSPLFIPDKNKLPFLVVLTDGYFYGNLSNKDLGMYEGSEKNVLFITKSSNNLYKDANYIKFK